MRTSELATLVATLAQAQAAVHLKTQHVAPDHKLNAILRAAGGSFSTNMRNTGGQIFANLTVGTPPQKFETQIDTGSDDFWVPLKGAPVCQQATSMCDSQGSYDPNSSSTASKLDTTATFSLGYGDGTQVNGSFVIDTLSIGSANLPNTTFAAVDVGTSSQPLQALMGVGYDRKSQATLAGGNSFFTSMVTQGLIKNRAYSFWLDDKFNSVVNIRNRDVNATGGNILFGGVDKAKYKSPLVSMPVFPAPATADDQSLRLTVPLTGVSFSLDGQSITYTAPNFNLRTLIDSGGEACDVPTDLANAIYSSLNLDPQNPILPCAAATSTGAFTFGFNGALNVTVPIGNFFRPSYGSDGTQATTASGQLACELLISPGNDLAILGIPFFRSAYMVYDLDNNQIGIAQSKPDSSDTNVQEMEGEIPADTILSTLSAGTTEFKALATQTASSTFSVPATGTTTIGGVPTTATATGTATSSTATALTTPKGNAAGKDVVLSKWLVGGLAAAAVFFM